VGQVVRPGCMGPDIGRYGGPPGRAARTTSSTGFRKPAGSGSTPLEDSDESARNAASRTLCRSTRYAGRERHHAILGGGRRHDLGGDHVGELQGSEVADAVDGAQADVAEELLQAV